MNINEKILLVELLLRDIRGNWGYWGIGRDAEERALKAKELCEEIEKENNGSRFNLLAHSCDEYIEASKFYGDWDGRWFRDEFPAGYENMDKLHGLNYTFKDKSDEFKSLAKEYLTYPEHAFEDW